MIGRRAAASAVMAFPVLCAAVASAGGCQSGSVGGERRQSGGGTGDGAAKTRSALSGTNGVWSGPTAARPAWIARLPSDDSALANRLEIPLLAGDVLVVASSLVGTVGLDRTSGDLQWRRGTDTRRAVLVGDRLVVPITCEGGNGFCLATLAPPTGATLMRAVVPAPVSTGTGAAAFGHPASLPEIVGVTGPTLLVADGLRLLAVDLGPPVRVTTSLHRPAPAVTLAGPPAALAADAAGGRTFALFPDGIASGGSAGGGFFAFEEPLLLGAAGPVAAGGVIIHGIDDALVGADPDDGRRRWTAAGRFAPVTGAVAVSPDGREVYALALRAGGVALITLAAESGGVVGMGPAVAAARVFAAAFDPDGAVAVALADAEGDVIQAFAKSGVPTWRWRLPAPAGGLRQARLLATREAVYALVDGSLAVRLPAAGSDQ